MTDISPTRVIGGRYVVLGELCRAAGGVVWRAEDRVTGRQVAVKELHLPRQSAEERLQFRERLLRAARAAGRTDAPVLVTVHDVVTDDDVEHVVTELVEAPTLAERVAADGPLDEPAVRELAQQLAGTLHALRAVGVAHGGVAPDTVLLGPRVRLAGLGVAEAADDAAVAPPPGFLAPELRDGGAASPESDVWALGATVFHALHGRPPAPRDVREERDGALAGVLAGMLRDAPQARLTARQVTALLETGAPPPTRGRGDRRWWAAAALVLGVAAGVVAGSALAGTGGPEVTTLTHGPDGDVRFAPPPGAACLRGAPAAGRWGGDDRVDCAGPHELEVLATLDPFAARAVPHPGRADLSAYAAAACTATFEALVTAPERDGLEVVALVPSRTAFEAGAPGGRAVHCLLRSAAGVPLVGSRISGEGG
ncbi:MAG TPA: protein kinase [Pseudonocardia sp.]|nr:protein kinase [Pseudonocardia sp.]